MGKHKKHKKQNMRQPNKEQQSDEVRLKQSGILVRLLIGAMLVVVIAAGLWLLSGEGKKPSEKLVFTVGTEEVYLDEVHFCILQNLLNMGITAEDMQNTTADDGSNLAEYYKQEIMKQIMNYKVEYIIAREQGLNLTEEEEKTVLKDVVEYLGTIDGRLLTRWGIKQELIEEVYTQRYMAQKLEKTVAETVEVEEQRFCTLYIMMFPKIEMTEDGTYATLEDGKTPIVLSDSELLEVKTNAELALRELEAGVEPEEVAKKYEVDAFSAEDSNLVESFEEPFLQYAKNLKENECSPVIEMEAYYAIVKMISENNEDYAEEILSYYREDQEEQVLKEQRLIWYEQLGIGEEPEYVGSTWKNISLYDYVQ